MCWGWYQTKDGGMRECGECSIDDRYPSLRCRREADEFDHGDGHQVTIL